MVRVLWEVSIARVIVLLFCIVALDVVGWMIFGVFVVIDSSVLVKIIVVRIRHWVVKIKQIMVMTIFKVLMLTLMLAVFVIVMMPLFSLIVSGFSLTERSLPFSHSLLKFSIKFFFLRSHLFFFCLWLILLLGRSFLFLW